MNFLLKYLFTLLISLSLVFTPITINKSYAAAKCGVITSSSTCSGTTGCAWNTNTNTCLISQGADTTNSQYKACNKLLTEAARKQCKLDLARSDSGVDEDDENTMLYGLFGACDPEKTLEQKILDIQCPEGLSTILAIFGLVSIINLDFNRCGKWSWRLILAAAVTNLYGEWDINQKYEGKAADIRSKYDATTSDEEEDDEDQNLSAQARAMRQNARKNSSGYKAQIAAFDYIIEMQKYLAELLEAKAEYYGKAKLLYMAGFIAAMAEIMSTAAGGDGLCATTSSGKSQLIDKLIKYLAINFFKIPTTLISSAKAKDKSDSQFGLFLGAATGTALIAGRTYLSNAMPNAVTRGIFALLAWLMNEKMERHALDEAKKAEKRAADIEAIKAKFVTGLGDDNFTDCTAEANKMLKQCYCYDTAGRPFTTRLKHPVCAGISSTFIASRSYDDDFGKSRISGCVERSGKMDPHCRCKKKINKKTKENGCMKVMTGSNGNSFGRNNFLSSAKQIANRSFAGNHIKKDKVGRAFYGNYAAKKMATRKLMNKISKKLKREKKRDIFSTNVLKGQLSSMGKLLTPAVAKARAGKVISSKISSKNTTLQKAINKINKQKKKSVKYESTKGKGAEKGKKKNDAFIFDDSNGPKVILQDDQFMDKKYNFGDSDITKNSGVPIWKIISNRYNRSAIPNFFPEEEVPQAEQKKK